MEQDMQHFIFSDETRATLDGPDRMGHDVEPPPSMSLKITGRQQLSSSTVLLILLLYLDLDKNRWWQDDWPWWSSRTCEDNVFCFLLRDVKSCDSSFILEDVLIRRWSLFSCQIIRHRTFQNFTKTCLTSTSFRDHLLMNCQTWTPLRSSHKQVEHLSRWTTIIIYFEKLIVEGYQESCSCSVNLSPTIKKLV